jgi:hypothetical protein
LNDKDQLVRRIIEEKGEKAVPILIDLLFEGDPEIADIAIEALEALDCCKQLFERLDLEMKKDEKNVGIYYIADLIGDKKCKDGIDYLKKMLNLIENENEALIVHGALLKLGFKDSEKYLLYEFENDPYMEEFLFDTALALSQSDDEDVLKAISSKAKDHPELIEILQSMCERNPAFFSLLPEDLREKVR